MKEPHATERLEVTNFLVLKDVKFDVKRFTVVMGEQATGKSLLAKLLYFFREGRKAFYSPQAFHRVANAKNIGQEFLKILEERFYDIFPVQTWKDSEFSISYRYNDESILIKNNKNSGLKIALSKGLLASLSKFASKTEEMKVHRNKLKKVRFAESIVDGILFSMFQLIEEVRFIPASRSLLSIIQQEAPAFMSTGGIYDPFMAKFWGFYNVARRRGRDLEGIRDSALIKQVTETILKGHYVFDGKKDWIEMRHGKVPLINASSGQQEALPMLLVLAESDAPQIFFVEEPEAHLFPSSQRLVVHLMAAIYNQGSSFFLTTHSPYILSALDNLIMASNVIQERKGMVKKVSAIIPKECHVRYEDVGAYTIENGKLISVLDAESKLINGDVIDDVSETFSGEFDALLALRHGR